ncbi:Phosphoribosylformylglycinamidine cyclo-ligase [Paraconexibacter sp. AEG42_29]|uniref:Phosphoribosylformylglycinamidine cyclo-ligase n=1 Tax=Paraconexibacter sp. AEG42_29 TaxID=2997339 RepID=A0AAU7AP51_9ACTN
MSESYAAAGVDTTQADEGVGALVRVLSTIELDRPSASVLPSGHYASVLRVAPNLGIAFSTDGVGSKLVLAEQADRLETVGIDCIAMNVNDIICVGAEPIAMVDYLAVEQADATALGRIAEGLKVGAQQANIEIPGGELAVIPELIRGHPSPHGFDLCGTAFGTVALDAVITGADAQPGDAIIGLPASGPHSNGYTLARHALLDDSPTHPALDVHATPAELGGASILDALLEPTVIYVRAIMDLIRSDVPVHGLAHLTGGGLTNLLRLGNGRLGWTIDAPLPVTPIFGLIQEHGSVSVAEMWEVFNMGCGFVCVVPADRADDAVAGLEKFHPGAAVIGTVTDAGGTVTVPSLGITGDKSGLRAG